VAVRSLDLFERGPGDEDEPEPERPKIYRAKWMRKPGDPDYEEDEGETAGGGETTTRREPVISDPEPPRRSARSEVEPQSQTVRPGNNTMTQRAVEPGENAHVGTWCELRTLAEVVSGRKGQFDSWLT